MLAALPTECMLSVLERVAVSDILRVACCCKGTRELCSDSVFWRQLAVRKWGPRVEELQAQSGEASWKDYCTKRLSFVSIKRSPLGLIQESYPDPWMHLVCCVLCSRTSGAAVVADTVRSFFRAFPSPSAVLDAAEADIQALIFPLGLQPIRCRSVCDISRAFLGTNWTEPSEFYGVGKFTTDSWRIFCRGDTRGAGVEDVNLRRYLSWLKTSGSGSSGGGGGDADGASGSQDGGRQRPSSSARKLRTAAADVATTKGQRSKTAAAKRQKQAAMLTAGALRRLTRSATATAASDAGAASRKRKAAAAPALPAAKSLSSKAKIQRRR